MSMFQEILSKRMEVSASFFWKVLKCEEAGVFRKKYTSSCSFHETIRMTKSQDTQINVPHNHLGIWK